MSIQPFPKKREESGGRKGRCNKVPYAWMPSKRIMPVILLVKLIFLFTFSAYVREVFIL